MPAGAIIAKKRQQHPTHPDVHPAVPRDSKDVQGGEEEGDSHARMTKSSLTSRRDEGGKTGQFEVYKNRNNNKNNNKETGVKKHLSAPL